MTLLIYSNNEETVKSKKPKKKFVLVRTYSAGVHFGQLKSKKGKEVVLINSRRIFRWNGANTLNEMSRRGIDVSRSKISDPCLSITLTEAIEIIPCSPAAIANLESAKWSQ